MNSNLPWQRANRRLPGCGKLELHARTLPWEVTYLSKIERAVILREFRIRDFLGMLGKATNL
jgi:hypothetical protein